MGNANLKPAAGKALDVVLVSLAGILAVAGVLAFTFLSDESLGVRLACLLGGLAAACALAWFSPTGKTFISFGRDSWEELRRVVWPNRKETVNTTGLVMAFVVAVAFYLFIVDKLIEWSLYDGLFRLSF